MQEKAKEADLAQKFKSQLNSSKDGFDVVAEYFGKGIFNKVRKDVRFVDLHDIGSLSP